MSGRRGPPQEIVERALAAAAGRECVVLVEETGSVNLRWAMNGLTTNGVSSSQSATVILAVPVAGGTGVGVLSRQGVGPGEVADLVASAAAEAGGAAPAEDAAPIIGGTALPGWDEPAAESSPAVLGSVATQLGEVLTAARGQQRESFGFALHGVSTTWLGTSGGLRLRHEQPQGTIELTGKSHARSRSTWVGQATRDFADVDVIALDEQVRARLGWQARRVELGPGRYDTVLPPTAVADLMAYLYWSADARSAYEGRSVFSRPGGGTRVGEQLTGLPLTLASDPDRAGLACPDRVLAGSSSPWASVFDNGLPSPAVTWLDAGRLAALPTTRFTAGLSGLPLTPSVDNLLLGTPNGAGDDLDLVRGLDRGLLLTCLWYIREVDPMTLLLTGLTRDGVYLVEGGEVTGAVTNFRFNESPLDVLSRVRTVGRSEVTLGREFGEYFTRTAMPPLHVEGFNMSSLSQAS